MADRILGAIISIVFVVPTVALLWLALNIEAAHIYHFFSTDLFLATALAAVVFGAVFPKVLPDLLGWLWRVLYIYGRWR